jgi:hypothetical protein
MSTISSSAVTATSLSAAYASAGSTSARVGTEEAKAAPSDAGSAKTYDRAVISRDARAVLDRQYAEAKAAGTQVVFDTSQSGRPLDLSSLSEESLAVIVNDKGKGFSKDESDWAAGELGSRVQRALAPLESGNPGDLRAYQHGVRVLYDNASQEVRDALGWTPQMANAADSLSSNSETLFGKLDANAFWAAFLKGQADPSAFHMSRLDTKA